MKFVRYLIVPSEWAHDTHSNAYGTSEIVIFEIEESNEQAEI